MDQGQGAHLRGTLEFRFPKLHSAIVRRQDEANRHLARIAKAGQQDSGHACASVFRLCQNCTFERLGAFPNQRAMSKLRFDGSVRSIRYALKL
jgi:hypothetical protein